MIDVGVGEHDAVDLLWIERKGAVPFHGFGPAALVEATIEQDALAIDFKEVLRASGGSGSAAEFDFHQ